MKRMLALLLTLTLALGLLAGCGTTVVLGLQGVLFYTMRAPFFGGGRGDWGEQDETVAVLEGGLEVEVQCIGLFP